MTDYDADKLKINRAKFYIDTLYAQEFVTQKEYLTIRHRLNRQAKLLELDEQSKGELKENE